MTEFVRDYLLIDSTLVSVAYLFTLLAYLVRDILPLRILLIGAAITMCGFGLRAGSQPLAIWNAVFVLVNAAHVVLLIRARRPAILDPDLQRIHREVFWIMRPREFLRLWERGETLECDGADLCRLGQVPTHLFLVLEGSVVVERDDRALARVGPLQMVGEMSFINRSPATADAVVAERARLRQWNRGALERLERSDPALAAKLNVVIGQDLVRKLTGTSEARGEITELAGIGAPREPAVAPVA